MCQVRCEMFAKLFIKPVQKPLQVTVSQLGELCVSDLPVTGLKVEVWPWAQYWSLSSGLSSGSHPIEDIMASSR